MEQGGWHVRLAHAPGRGVGPGILAAFIGLALACGGGAVRAADVGQVIPAEGDCLECHASPLTTTFKGSTVDLRVDPSAYSGSPHGRIRCVLCHTESAHAPLDRVRAVTLASRRKRR